MMGIIILWAYCNKKRVTVSGEELQLQPFVHYSDIGSWRKERIKKVHHHHNNRNNNSNFCVVL